MWAQLPIRSLVDMQRREAFNRMGLEALQLHLEGYPVERDRVLDEMNDRQAAWLEETRHAA